MLTSSYPRFHEDSSGIFIRHMAEALVRRGVAVHVLAPAFDRGGTCLENGVTVHRFRYLPPRWQKLAYGSGILLNLKRSPWLWLEVPFFLATMSYSLFRLLGKMSPDVIHAHWVLPQGFIAVFAKLFYRVPVVVTVHGSDVFSLSGRLFDALRRWVLSQSSAWTSSSHSTTITVGDSSRLSTYRVLPMGIDINHFQTGDRQKLRAEVPDEEFLLLFIGRLIGQKGIYDLLNALTALPPPARSRTTLWLIGDGQEHDALEQSSRILGMEGKVRFWGAVSYGRLPDFYAAADLLVVPSTRAEGQGLVLSEAFAAGLCVLATRVPGIMELVEDGRTGILVEPGNSRQLAAAIERLLDNRALRQELSANARTKIQADRGWEEIARGFETLYRSLLSRIR
jgi:glycosyltransferase involved in cell wall biosynthesis